MSASSLTVSGSFPPRPGCWADPIGTRPKTAKRTPKPTRRDGVMGEISLESASCPRGTLAADTGMGYRVYGRGERKMKIDIFNHILPPRFVEKFQEVAARHGDMVKRVRHVSLL